MNLAAHEKFHFDTHIPIQSHIVIQPHNRKCKKQISYAWPVRISFLRNAYENKSVASFTFIQLQKSLM